MFDIRDFDIGGNQDSIGRLISIFFKDPEHYWRRNVISQADFSKEHNLGPRFQEIVALQRLFAEYSSPKFDDRSATIEAQIPADILINQGDLLGVVLPKEYLRDEEIHNALKSITKQILSYDIYPIALDQYYGSIYEKVQQIYKNCRIIE